MDTSVFICTVGPAMIAAVWIAIYIFMVYK